MTVYYTSNEIRSGIPGLLHANDVPCERKELLVGDYFCGRVSGEGAFSGVPVERKEVGDYLRSMNDGRRDEQLYNMSHGFPLSYVVIIGNASSALRRARATEAAYVSSLVGSSLKRSPDGASGQVVTVNLEGNMQFILFLKYLDEKVREGTFTRVPGMQKRAMNPGQQLVYVVSSLPGIGLKTATSLLRHFGSVRAVMSASKDELMQVEGVGEKRAKEVYAVLTASMELEVVDTQPQTVN